MTREAQRREFRGFLVRVPGVLVVGAWLVLFLGSFGVAALVDWAEYQNTVVGRAQRRVDQLERSQYRPDNPFRQERLAEEDPYLAAVERAFAEDSTPEQPVSRLEDLLGPDSNRAAPSAESDSSFHALVEAARAKRWAVAGILGAGLVWLLAFTFVTVSTTRWVTARDGWASVQSWHGGKLLMLYVPFTAATLLYAAAATLPVVAGDEFVVATLLGTSGLILLACAAMLVRATWNWLTGRQTHARSHK